MLVVDIQKVFCLFVFCLVVRSSVCFSRVVLLVTADPSEVG